MWCAVGTRRSSPQGGSLAALGGALLALAGCQFEPFGTANPTNLPDASGNVEPFDARADAPPTPDVTLCVPNESVCSQDRRAVTTCNESGNEYLPPTVCPFTCEDEGEPRCTSASNIPDDRQPECAATAARLTPAPGTDVTFEAVGGERIVCSPNCGDGSTQIPATDTFDDGNLHLAWFCLAELNIPAGVTVDVGQMGFGRAIAIQVTGPAVVAGTIDVRGRPAAATIAGAGGPGGAAGGGLATNDSGRAGGGLAMCGGRGGTREPDNGDNEAGGGGGGGGQGGGGGIGGEGHDGEGDVGAGGAPGTACGEPDLEPLVGGSGGGGGGAGGCEDCGWPGGGGGGAIQIAAGGGITISGSGRIVASGGNGFGDPVGINGRGGAGGGGSGGAILLEAPQISVASGTLLVEGGAGGNAGAGNGGPGGSGGRLAGEAGTNASLNFQGGAGGGGGGGRIRLNASVQPSCEGVGSPQSACTTDALR